MEDNESGQWGIAELMGHKVVAGFITKSEMLGKPMLRVDVPTTTTYPAFTQLYGEAAIYCVTFTSEEVARRTAESTKLNPVSVYVPDLITKEKYEEAQERFQQVVDRYRAEIESLRRGLPARTNHADTDDPKPGCPNCGRPIIDFEEDFCECGERLKLPF